MSEQNQSDYYINESKVHYQNALKCKQEGRLEDALRECDEAIESNQYVSEAHNLHGSILEEMGQIIEAFRSYKRAISLDSFNQDAVTNLNAIKSKLQTEIKN